MIKVLADKFSKRIACILFMIFYAQLLSSASAEINLATYTSGEENYHYTNFKDLVNYSLLERGYHEEKNSTPVKVQSNAPHLNYPVLLVKRSDGPGPGQPEMSSFQSVNSSDMVDKFTGDFSYNIPLMDVGGYPINIAYRSGISMDQEASWVGLGWNINPGTITRNMRGVPDDFDGQDTITKTQSIRRNQTIGGTYSQDDELLGINLGKLKLTLGKSIGFFHNTYKGW